MAGVAKDARLRCRRYERSVALGAALTLCCGSVAPAAAHGFGQRYDLSLPLSLYLFGTAAAVVLSFVVVGLFTRHAPGSSSYPRVDLTAYPPGRWLAHPAPGAVLKLIAAGLFILTVTAGFFGSQNPYRNIRRPWCGSSGGSGWRWFRPSPAICGRWSTRGAACSIWPTGSIAG